AVVVDGTLINVSSVVIILMDTEFFCGRSTYFRQSDGGSFLLGDITIVVVLCAGSGGRCRCAAAVIRVVVASLTGAYYGVHTALCGACRVIVRIVVCNILIIGLCYHIGVVVRLCCAGIIRTSGHDPERENGCG